MSHPTIQNASWRERFEAAAEELLKTQEQLETVTAEKEELENRLAEIHDISAPPERIDERLERIETAIQELTEGLNRKENDAKDSH